MNWKNFFYFHHETKFAILLLLILIAITFSANIFLSNRKQIVIPSTNADSLNAELQEFHKTVIEQNNIATPQHTHTTPHHPSPTKKETNQKPVSKPNTTTTETEKKEPTSNYPQYPTTEKLNPGQTISLNETDMEQWKKVPGIGDTFSRRIVSYQNLLGGYIDKKQLLEIYGMDNELFEKISPYVHNEGGSIKKLPVNKTTEFKDFLKHPYLDYEQVKAIMNLKRRKGTIASINELAMLSEFTEQHIERLKPYLLFD